MFYLFNDSLLVASLEVVEGVFARSALGFLLDLTSVHRTTEALKKLNRDVDYVTPVLLDQSGNEIIHKYKFQRLINIDTVEVVKYVPLDDMEPPLDHAVRVFFSRGEQAIYQSPNVDERNLY